jgi:hypothetical protein
MRKLSAWESDSRTELKKTDFWLQETSYVAILGLVIGICLLIANIIQLIELDAWVNAYGCELRYYTSVVLWVLLVVCVVGVLVAFLVLRNMPDHYDMKNELIVCFIVWVIALVPYLIIYQIRDAGSDYLGLLMFVFIAAGYFTSVIRPIYLSYKCLPVESTGGLLGTIEEMLMEAEGFELMLTVAALHHGKEMCNCAREILIYRQIENDRNMAAEARRLFDHYVRTGGEEQCDLGGNIVKHIEDRMENPPSDLFNRAFQEFVKLPTTNYLREVKQMEEYAKLLDKREKEAERRRKGQEILKQ